MCGGDLIDWTFTKGIQNISSAYKQAEHFINDYSHDSSILTFGVAGDHDYSAFSDAYADIIEICNNYRQDVIIGGYNNTGINIKNDQIHLFHYILGCRMRNTIVSIILSGHSHNFSTQMKNDTLSVSLSSLSDTLQSIPTALELEVNFSNGFIVNSSIKQIYFGNQDITLNESSFNFLNNKSISSAEVINIVDYKNSEE